MKIWLLRLKEEFVYPCNFFKELLTVELIKYRA